MQLQFASFISEYNPTHYRTVELTVSDTMASAVDTIATAQKINTDDTLCKLIALGLEVYKFKQKLFNAKIVILESSLYCQNCSLLTRIKHSFKVTLFNDDYVFCDQCFYTYKHITFGIRMLENYLQLQGKVGNK